LLGLLLSLLLLDIELLFKLILLHLKLALQFALLLLLEELLDLKMHRAENLVLKYNNDFPRQVVLLPLPGVVFVVVVVVVVFDRHPRNGEEGILVLLISIWMGPVIVARVAAVAKTAVKTAG
jgi:hypothetical protein